MSAHASLGARAHASLYRLCWLAGALAAFAGLAGCFGRHSWILDGFAHFRWQYALTLLPACLLAAVAKRTRLALLFGAGLVLNGALIARVHFDAPPPRPTLPTSRLRLLVVNLHADNATPERLLPVIAAYKPDMVGVVELSHAAAQALAPLQREFPVSRLLPQDDPFGIGLWVRATDAKISITRSGSLQLTTLLLDHADAQGAVHLVLTHPFPPIGAEGTAARDMQLEEVAASVHAVADDAIVAGDLNLTPWSSAYRSLREQSRLFDSLAGQWPWPTWWPAPGLGRIFAVPIDQVLIGANWRCVERSIGPDVGSDHRPLIVTLERAAP